MSLVGQLMFDGITIGMVYVILAAGLVFILSITEILFIAYGMFYMIGAYAVWYAINLIHVSYFLALVVGVIATALLGVVSYILIFQRLQRVDGRFLATITAAMGLSLVLGQGGLIVFGTYPRSIPNVFQGSHELWGIPIGNDQLALIIMGVIVTVVLFYLYEKTRIGRAMRAVSYQPEVASLHGINVNRIYLITMGISTGLAGFAGAILAPRYSISPDMGNNILLSVLLMVMLGGMDSLLGALLGGLVVGLVLSFGQYFIGGLVQIILFFVIGVIIYFRPAGLLGKRTDIGV